jgi:hypothetical protein
VCSRRRAATARPEGPAPMIRMSWRGGRVVLSVVVLVLAVLVGREGCGIVGVVGWVKLLIWFVALVVNCKVVNWKYD